MADMALSVMQGAFSLVVPSFPERQPFGPRPAQEVVVSLLAMTALCSAAGYFLTRASPTVLLRLLTRIAPGLQLRDEVWEEAKLGIDAISSGNRAAEEGSSSQRKFQMRKRTGAELLFIVVHNAAVTTLACAAWLLGSPSLALHAFCLEVSYEIFDTFSLGLQRMEPETLIHHIVSPICIICSTQTDVDFRVLCHLCICIDLSGSILGFSKFLLRFSHISATKIYKRLFYIYALLRVALPLIDSVIIVVREVTAKGGFFARFQSIVEDGSTKHGYFARTDWTQLYFWAMAVLNAFNIYFCLVIRARATLPPHIVASYEARMGGCD